MNPNLFAALYSAMEDFVKQNCESADWYDADFFAHPNLALHMAQAAAVVFVATVESSKYAENETR